MIEETLEITTPDGTADAVLFRPDDGTRLPGAIHLTDIGGIRPSQYEMARELAERGYVVLMPNIFYRTGRPPLIDFPVGSDDERTKQRVSEMRAPLVPEAIERDAAAYVAALVGSSHVSGAPIGVVGYCLSGKIALCAAALRPDRVGAAASFHGGYLVTDDATSPHLLLPRIKARLYFGHAIDDHSMPTSAIETLDRALAAWGGKYESEVYEGAYHSWTEPDSPVYNPAQAQRAFEKLTELFSESALGKPLATPTMP
jgi:carboxymethylenebutenolidase